MNIEDLNKHKENSFEMSNNLPPNLKEYVLSITNLKTEEELGKYLNNIIDNGKLDTIFNIAAKEFNIYTNSNLAFEFHTWHNKNRLEFQQIQEHIYMSSGFLVPLYSFYAIILYQADHLDEEPIKRKCFQNLLGIIMDSCLWNCEPVAINAFEFVLNEAGNGGNYLSLAGALTCTSLCFACLHEMAHFYLHHDNMQLGENKDDKLEYEADKLAYKVFLSILEKNKKHMFDGGVYTDCFQEYTYLSPAMFIGFMHSIKLVDIILYENIKEEHYDINQLNNKFEELIGRKEAIIDYIENCDVEIDTEDGNCLYGGFEVSLDSFAGSLVVTEEIGNLEKYKYGGWERADEEKVKTIFISNNKNAEELKFIDVALKLMEIECQPIPQEFIGIDVHRTDPITGYTSKISNIKLDLNEILKLAIISALQFLSDDPLSYMILFVELIFTLYGKTKRYFSERDCKVLLSLKKLIDQGEPNIDEEKLKMFTKKEYPDISDNDFLKAIRTLMHLDCIEIEEGNIFIIESINIRYDY